MTILFLDTAHPVLIESLRADGHTCTEGYSWSREKILASMTGVNGICIRSRIFLDKEFLDASPDLKFIARAGAGMESIDVNYAKQKGIVCLNSPEGNRVAVGEHAAGMLLSLFNNLNKTDHQVRAGRWIREENRGVELSGKTVGIIGYGNMGSAFAKCLSGFGCTVLAYDKYLNSSRDINARLTSMEELFDQSDIISLHIPLTQETEYLVNDAFLNSFKKNIYVVNTARGKCIRISDLVKNLKTGKVKGACLDVLEYEDLSFEKFSITGAGLLENADWQYLISAENVLFSPHIAGWTFESLEKIALVLLEKIRHLQHQ
jgi:D-3-phosphoglycerate dehydrogenase / 2-oxoglutarate reductase